MHTKRRHDIAMRSLSERIHAAFHQPDTDIYRYVQGFVAALIVLSILLLVLEAMLPATNPAAAIIPTVDRVLLIIFAVEILLRVGTYRPPSLEVFRRPPISRLPVHALARLRYLLQPLMLVDILAVLALFPELRGLRALRLLRLLRATPAFRYRNPFAIALQAFEESSLLFGLAFSVLGGATLLGGVSLYLVEGRINPNVDSVIDGLWWALVTVTTVGFGDITPVTLLGRIIGAGLMVAGMFTLALFAGIVGSSLVSGMLAIREEQFRMSEYVNHIVVCGYDESTRMLLDALALELSLGKRRVVVFDVHDRPRNLPTEVLWVQGDPTKESELDKVRIAHAAAVIVSGERDTTPQVADARTILITFTVRAYLSNNRRIVRLRRSPLYVVAEILDSENVGHARTAGADEVIETRRIGFSMIAHAIRYHGTATAMSGVLLSGAHNVYVGQLPTGVEPPVPFGELLITLQLSKRGGLVIGLRTAEGQEIINPPKSLSVEPGTHLLYLAEEALLEPPQ